MRTDQRRRAPWWSAAWLLILGMVALPAVGQRQEPPPEEPAEDEAQEFFEAPTDTGEIDEILRSDEEIFGDAGGYAYDPGERRDPFRSLLASLEPTEGPRQRPEGVPGLLIDEISLIGIWKTPRGFVAQVQAADKQKSFQLREEDELFDGEVVTISENEVVFRQVVDDPTALKPFRERVKVLNP